MSLQLRDLKVMLHTVCYITLCFCFVHLNCGNCLLDFRILRTCSSWGARELMTAQVHVDALQSVQLQAPPDDLPFTFLKIR